jgi:hypothetical protein
MRSSVLFALGAVVSAIAYTPISTSRIPPNYNFTNVPFDSHTAYFFLDYIEGVIDAIPDSANKTSFLNASPQSASCIPQIPPTFPSLVSVKSPSPMAIRNCHHITKPSNISLRSTSFSPTLLVFTPGSNPRPASSRSLNAAMTPRITPSFSLFSILIM